MAKKTINKSDKSYVKTQGRSHGPVVYDPVLKNHCSTKIFNARKSNNPKRYENIV